MIKFFRHIRKSLLMENKMGKYFKYAVGEIVLVVFGILIALQINNWNELKKAREKENNALTEIISDLDTNISSLNGIVYTDANAIVKCMKSINIIIKNLQDTKVYNDTLNKHFWQTFRYPDLDLKSSGYESLTSIGMDLISDNETRSEIGKYYTYSIPDLKAAYKELRDDFYHYMLDLLRKEFIATGIKNDTKTIIPVNYELLVANREYVESLKTYFAVFDYYQEKSIEVIKASNELKAKIELNL